MRPIGFVKRHLENGGVFTKDKIYPYFEIIANDTVGLKISLKNDYGEIVNRWMFIDQGSSHFHHFTFYNYPEFPEDILLWTEDDWFQYHLKYGG